MKYDHITHASDERLAEMLEDKLDTGCNAMHLDALEFMECVREAARRLRRPKNCPFNSEQFE